jgi:hypothetical protein
MIKHFYDFLKKEKNKKGHTRERNPKEKNLKQKKEEVFSPSE